MHYLVLVGGMREARFRQFHTACQFAQVWSARDTTVLVDVAYTLGYGRGLVAQFEAGDLTAEFEHRRQEIAA